MTTNDIEITFAKRLRKRVSQIWCEDILESNGTVCVKDYDSISQEELRRFVDLDLIDADGYMTKTFPLTRIFIRPRTAVA